MVTNVIILPVVCTEQLRDTRMLQVTLHRRDFGRLLRLAESWKISPAEAVAAIVENELHRGRRW